MHSSGIASEQCVRMLKGPGLHTIICFLSFLLSLIRHASSPYGEILWIVFISGGIIL
jgi:hypothetical protein